MFGLEQIVNIPGNSMALLGLVMVWSIIWKGVALWKAGRAGSKVWFILLLILNTLGILEIIYIFLVNKKKSTNVVESE
jgi:hypothetical protein